MRVGVNYPWFDYGWDFGPAPPGWRGDRISPRWFDAIDGHLAHLHDLGIRSVRWFVLADGLAYGSGAQAPWLETGAGVWHFDPPPLGWDLLDHFEELLRRFLVFNTNREYPIQLLPVLVDFHFCGAGKSVGEAGEAWIKRGRADAVADAARRQMFFDAVLDPLLEISRQYAQVIYAWDVMNEPDWVTNGWHPDRRRTHAIDEDAMRDFLVSGADRIQRAGFKATVGFALIETLFASGIRLGLNQFHHYAGGTRVLPPQSFDDRIPAIVGEFATAAGDVWPEFRRTRQTVLNRLLRIEAQGYPAAIAWSFLARDRHTAWSPAVERDFQTFTRGDFDTHLFREP